MNRDKGGQIMRALLRCGDDARTLGRCARSLGVHTTAVMGTVPPAAGRKACIILQPERKEGRGKREGEDRQQQDRK